MMDVVCVFYLAQILTGMVSGDPESNQLRKTVSVSDSGTPVRGMLKDVAGIDFSLTNRSAERRKRQSPANKHFTKEDKIILLKKHNELRRLQNSSNMALMYWNDDVEKYAQDWVNGCKFAHSGGRNKTITGFHGAGENLWAGSGGYNAESIVKSWYSEIRNYDYDNARCQEGKACGHYTQVVWAVSKFLGCALTKCPGMSLVVCNYVPWGNYAGARPFRKGDACTECKEGNDYCSAGLCSKRTGNMRRRTLHQSCIQGCQKKLFYVQDSHFSKQFTVQESFHVSCGWHSVAGPIPSIIGGSSQIFSSSAAALSLALQFSVMSQAVFS